MFPRFVILKLAFHSKTHNLLDYNVVCAVTHYPATLKKDQHLTWADEACINNDRDIRSVEEGSLNDNSIIRHFRPEHALQPAREYR